MAFAHDTVASLTAAVALANSALEPESLGTTDELAAFFAEHDYTGRHDGTDAELAAVQVIRGRLRALLISGRDEAVTLTNDVLRVTRALPQLVRHGEVDWHLHAVDSDRPLAERILVESAMAMVDVIRADEMSRLGVCADGSCEGVVLDLTRNRSRRYCSTACSNRNAVAAYRARQAT
ncbi:RNA-binding protein [Epidermidibacterium keratini]|uniref:RNA-binding protein n=1 Tax=Epidermidibacterium keratini TaxID=1891644 RepID=A0A7L4YM34_9ACTN|nr:CGNR zinc finger domain-containing protein [Epidermidibacterium keratini]QHB99606.1 RNA-binding protein [Epidermidibacterium keratini]